MRELFEAIDNCEAGSVNMVLTVLDGEYLGEKALVSDGKLIWESNEEGFFSKYEEAVCQMQDSGVVGIMMGWEVTVLEDRPKFADNARRAGASHVICEPFEEGLDKVPGSSDTYFVIVTRGHRYDQACLEKIAEKEHAYIGMIGSRRRTTLVKKLLEEQGTDKAVLDAVYTPIGLDIGAETPEEIGVAIMAEIIEVKNKKKRTFGYSEEIVRAIMDTEKYPGRKVMTTIITRKGSAPQGIGVKMLVLADGNCIGTIGGGCMESAVLQKALLLLRSDDTQARICQADLTGNDAEDEGMVCGGMVDVLLEVIE